MNIVIAIGAQRPAAFVNLLFQSVNNQSVQKSTALLRSPFAELV